MHTHTCTEGVQERDEGGDSCAGSPDGERNVSSNDGKRLKTPCVKMHMQHFWWSSVGNVLVCWTNAMAGRALVYAEQRKVLNNFFVLYCQKYMTDNVFKFRGRYYVYRCTILEQGGRLKICFWLDSIYSCSIFQSIHLCGSQISDRVVPTHQNAEMCICEGFGSNSQTQPKNRRFLNRGLQTVREKLHHCILCTSGLVILSFMWFRPNHGGRKLAFLTLLFMNPDVSDGCKLCQVKGTFPFEDRDVVDDPEANRLPIIEKERRHHHRPDKEPIVQSATSPAGAVAASLEEPTVSTSQTRLMAAITLTRAGDDGV